MANISFYGSHNGAYVVEDGGKILMILEIERYLKFKNSGLAQYKTPHSKLILYLAKHIPQFLMKTLNITEFENCYYQNTDVIMDGVTYHLERYIPAKNYISKLHHESHAAGCFYQSPFEDALVISFDGGGNDGMFNIYTANRESGVSIIKRVLNPVFNTSHLYYNLGFAYMVFAHYLADIQFENLGDGNLVYPGKIMGLASYGSVREHWVPYFKQFYKNNPEGHNYEPLLQFLQHHINTENTRRGDPEIQFDINNRLSGQIAYDIAATSQRAFEECFFEVVAPYLEEHPNLPVCITGGCALNITLNTKLASEFNRTVFVGPNPNDCGIATGMILNELKPKTPIDITYSGIPLLDIDMLGHHIADDLMNLKVGEVDQNTIATDLLNGKIIGIARGNSEHGPRALGNRSIICNPSIENMKDILNEKVKHREWYRPFAPVVRLEDVSKYFEWEGESRWMSFSPVVRKEWREKLSAITHIDNTARVQTVTREQNEWLYDLLTHFSELSGIGVLLNTSFNVNGSPILSSINEAFQVFNNSAMDGLVIENTYITKNT
jgi:carbamoyltransferase